MKKSLVHEGILYGLLLYLLFTQLLAIWPFTIDDTYISLRYAKHWAQASEIAWNLHAPPVEGYSNFSFLVLGTLALVFKVSPVITLKIAGLIGLIGTLFFIFKLSRFFFERREALLPCIGILLYKGQIIWAVSGLETSVFEALLAGSVYFSLRGLGYSFFPLNRTSYQNAFFFMAGLLLSLAGLTRPEAPLFMVLFFIIIGFDKEKALPTLFSFSLPILFIYLPYFLWRWHYYGLLFPNPVYCKGFVPETLNLLDKHYLKLIWPFFLFSLPAIQLHDKRPYFLCLPSLLYLILLFHADPVVAFDNRLFLPAFILVFPLALQGISELLLWYLKERDRYYFICFYMSFAFFASLFIPTLSPKEYTQFTLNPLAGERLRQRVLAWLDKHTTQDDAVVLGDCGMIPYYSPLHYIDSYCLNNKAMGQFPKEQRYTLFCHQVLEQKPKVLILTSLIHDQKTEYTPSDRCLKQLLTHQKEYTLIKTFQDASSASLYRYELFMYSEP